MRLVFAIVDGVAILLACYVSRVDSAADRDFVLSSAVLLMMWQGFENGLLRRRFGGTNLPAYPGGLAWCMAVLAAVLWAALLDRKFDGAEASVEAGSIGLVLCAAGIALRLAAFGTLGTEFLRPPGTNLSWMRNGPYRWLRHPAGWGLLLLGLGQPWFWGSVWGLAATAVFLLPSLLYVHRIEESAAVAAGLSPALTFSQRFIGSSLAARLYEPLIHPVFLRCFTRYYRFETIYQTLRRLGPAGAAPNRTALDIACGTAWFGRRVLTDTAASGAIARVVAIDRSPAMLAVARQLADRQGIDSQRLQLSAESAEDLSSLAAQSFDEVWLCGALHQIPSPMHLLREAARVLKPEGLLFCQTFVESPQRWQRGLLRGVGRRAGFAYFAPDGLVEMLRAAGLAICGKSASGCVLLFCARLEPARPTAEPHRVLVLGGTGCTGRLIVRDLLRHCPSYWVDVGARHPARADDVPPAAGRVRVDLGDEAATVRTLSRYHLVIIAVGPFEALGNRPHRLCIEAGVPCLDINDSLPAAQAIFELTKQAENKGVPVLTGMGLSPGLTTLLLQDVLARSKPQSRRLRLRLFVGGNQDAGHSAIRAMLASFTRQMPEIVDGTFRERPAEDRVPECCFHFPGTQASARVWHYPTPEAWTLPRFRSEDVGDVARMDYRVHFQGIPPALVWVLRAAPLLRGGLPAELLARIMHVIHDLLKRWKFAGAIAVAEVVSDQQTLQTVARAPSSYEGTARFASAIAQMLLENQLAVRSGVHSLETAISDTARLYELLGARGIEIWRG